MSISRYSLIVSGYSLITSVLSMPLTINYRTRNNRFSQNFTGRSRNARDLSPPQFDILFRTIITRVFRDKRRCPLFSTVNVFAGFTRKIKCRGDARVEMSALLRRLKRLRIV
ncbi:hypothetical protein PUN28_011656 [Cardiocondyla obscurior]|uniref:Secreted protein n=1 Tax=Cardiocondyla obscurior TaxID=286306 RepID=A0AAW2FEY0_9HYME